MDSRRHPRFIAYALVCIGVLAPALGHAKFEKSVALCKSATTEQTATLNELARIVEINLTGRNCADLYKKLAKKNELVLTKSRDLQDLTPLRELTHVTALTLSKNKIDDLTPIAGLKKLKSLTADHNMLRDISTIQNFKNLSDLDVSDNPITDIAVISKLRGLKTLFVNNLKSTDSMAMPLNIGPLATLTKLKFLALSNNGITDISPLSGLTNLESLNLANNNIANLSPVSMLSSIRNLNIAANQITDIKSLQPLTQLEALMAAHNKITDISPLSQLANLIDVDISHNALTDIAPLKRNPNLNGKSGLSLNVRNNPLRDCSAKTVAELQSGKHCARIPAAQAEAK
ncbi:MAG: leucine-rich repeat domain-containing protein [Gammaproteobacteria bacterium]|nr:leucine-rich repeat domain-containing protein [Gammaproteobacteria bacterium]